METEADQQYLSPELRPSSPKTGSIAWVRAEWTRFHKVSAEHGGLTQPSLAALRLNISRARVGQLMDDGHLRSFTFFGKRYVSCRDVEAFSELERHSGYRYSAA
jgi:hypothetical protein